MIIRNSMKVESRKFHYIPVHPGSQATTFQYYFLVGIIQLRVTLELRTQMALKCKELVSLTLMSNFSYTANNILDELSKPFIFIFREKVNPLNRNKS